MKTQKIPKIQLVVCKAADWATCKIFNPFAFFTTKV